MSAVPVGVQTGKNTSGQARDPGGLTAPPNDMVAEQSVLGAMLLSVDAVGDVVETVVGADFYRPAHEQIFDTVIDLYGRGEPVDPVTVAAELGRRGLLVKIGGAPYLHDLIASVPVAANASFYADIVREKAILRKLQDASTRITQWSAAGEGEVDDIVDRSQAEMMAVTDRRHGTDYQSVAALLPGALDEIEAIAGRGDRGGVPTGFIDLDAVIHGLQPGQMLVVGARPGVGKSTLGLDLARAAAVAHGLPTVIFSLEMSHTEIMMRLLSAEGSVPLENLRSGQMRDDDWTRVANIMGKVSEAPLYIDDSANLSMTEIRAKARRLKQRQGLRLIIIDYLQLMSSGRRVESRQVEVSEFSRQIKLIAKELGVPVVALSQLNRGPEQRTDRRPQLSDLRESGAVEQDADLVILMHRPDMYDPASSRVGEVDLHLAKHRNGPTATITLSFQGHFSRLTNMASI
jgi:replicative DNA helicase